jgi:hypothetical protein
VGDVGGFLKGALLSGEPDRVDEASSTETAIIMLA